MRKLVRFASKEPLVGDVDFDAGIIHGVAVCSIGEASGHGFYVDETMVDQVVAAMQEKEPVGTKCRFDHPNACSRAIGTFTGRFHNARRDDGKARADLHLAESAAVSPDGDLRTYVLNLAAEDPDAFATSIVFRFAEPEIVEYGDEVPSDDPRRLPHVRLSALHHCDVVDEGAANDGLFGRPDYFAEQAEKWMSEHPALIGRALSKYYDWKQKREEQKMSDELKREMEAELAAAVKERDEAQTELAAAQTRIEELSAASAEQVETVRQEGRTEIVDRLSARIEKYGDRDFVLETIEMSDEEIKDEYISRIQAGKLTPDGERGVDFSESDDDDEATFEDKVQEKMEAGLSRGKAIQACAKEFPELHKASIEKANEPKG